MIAQAGTLGESSRSSRPPNTPPHCTLPKDGSWGGGCGSWGCILVAPFVPINTTAPPRLTGSAPQCHSADHLPGAPTGPGFRKEEGSKQAWTRGGLSPLSLWDRGGGNNTFLVTQQPGGT